MRRCGIVFPNLQSLTIPFAGLHICFNIGFARLLNREQFTSRQVGFTFIILVGVTVVLVSGNHDTVTFSVSEMEDLFRETPFILTTSIMLLIIMILAPIAFMHPDPRARCLCTSALVGTIGSCTQVFAKTMAESFDEAVDNRSTSIFQSFVPGVAIAATTVCALTQLTMLNIALARFNAFVVVPIVNSTMIVLGSLYAAIFFQEFKRFDLESKILMPVGILTTSVGVALLAWDHDPEQASELVTGSPTNEHGIAMMERSHSFGGFHDSSHYDELRLPFQRSPTHPGPLRSSISSPGGSYQGLQEHEHFQRIQPSTQLETEDEDDEEYHRETSMTLS